MNDRPPRIEVVPKSRLALGTLLALLAALGYSAEAIAAKLLYARGLEPLTVLSWRLVLAAVIFRSWAKFYPPPGRWGRPDKKIIIVEGLCKGAAIILLFYAFMYISAGLAIFLFYLYPALVTILEALVLQRKPSTRRLQALGMTLIGLAIIAFPTLHAISFKGVLYAVGAALANAVYLLLSEHSLIDTPLAVLSAGTTTVAAVAVLALTFIARAPLHFPATAANLGLLLFLVFVPSVLALSCMLTAVSCLGPARTSILAAVEPFLTALLGLLILGEHLMFTDLIGGLLIVAAVVADSS